jgi:hypothetical protein
LDRLSSYSDDRHEQRREKGVRVVVLASWRRSLLRAGSELLRFPRVDTSAGEEGEREGGRRRRRVGEREPSVKGIILFSALLTC